ncbi:MAG TPA: hypothetical protein VJ464_16850 [Blastocatellia bacterium]|nr:hypothetical protein [Blastocatellia bacterium]
MNQPRLSQLDIWRNHESRVLRILFEALRILQKKKLPLSETRLNRDLYFCLLEANRKLWEAGVGGFDHPPTPEGKNPPDPDDDYEARREKMIPDFYWSFIDYLVTDPKRSGRFFFIECKRLGKPKRTDWIFNENYINHGVLRFVTEEHAYAQGEISSAMVGYVQNMEFDEILREVNETAKAVSVPILVGPIGGWQKNDISILEHELERPFPISPLKLNHFWVDLRECELA